MWFLSECESVEIQPGFLAVRIERRDINAETRRKTGAICCESFFAFLRVSASPRFIECFAALKQKSGTHF